MGLIRTMAILGIGATAGYFAAQSSSDTGSSPPSPHPGRGIKIIMVHDLASIPAKEEAPLERPAGGESNSGAPAKP